MAGFDTFASYQGDPWLVIGRRPAGGASLKQWILEMTTTKTITYPASTCSAPEHISPAALRWFHCPVDGPHAVGVQVLALHRGNGYVVMCYSESGVAGTAPAMAAACQDWLRLFHFVD